MSQSNADFLASFNGLPYSVRITDTATGEQRLIPVGDGVVWGDSSAFWWSEGNMGCDCNRAAEFYRNGGEYPCDTGRRRRFTVDAFEFEGHPTHSTLGENELDTCLNPAGGESAPVELSPVAKAVAEWQYYQPKMPEMLMVSAGTAQGVIEQCDADSPDGVRMIQDFRDAMAAMKFQPRTVYGDERDILMYGDDKHLWMSRVGEPYNFTLVCPSSPSTPPT